MSAGRQADIGAGNGQQCAGTMNYDRYADGWKVYVCSTCGREGWNGLLDVQPDVWVGRWERNRPLTDVA